METKLTISFTGNRPQKVSWLGNPASMQYQHLEIHLCNEIKEFYKKGYKHYISGMGLGADTIAARCVLDLKRSYPDITLECALPCKNQDEKWSYYDKRTYRQIISCADKVTYVSEWYDKECMFKRNRYLVDKAHQIIAMWNLQKSGGTWYTVEYARKQKKGVMVVALCNNGILFDNVNPFEVSYTQFAAVYDGYSSKVNNRGESCDFLDSLIDNDD